MSRMKEVFIVFILFLLFSACGNNKKEKNVNKEKGENMEVIYLTKAEFLKRVYNYEDNPKSWKYEGDRPAIIDFYATWCGPCKTLSPILDNLAKEYDGKIYIYKVDVDKEKELARVFSVQSIPTLLFIPMNVQPVIAQGMRPKTELKKMIDEILLGDK